MRRKRTVAARRASQVRMVDGTEAGAAKPFAPKKGKACVVMFVGLQGAGKTTSCTKYAYWHARKGFKPALVCADTFRAGAFDQLKQNATKAKIPFFGSYTDTDPAAIAAEGVERFRADGRDLIIVDTSGRHMQEAALFEEMRAVAAAVSPDLTIFVMDASIGQAVSAQAAAFRDAVDVGAVIVTKLDGHAKGGGALAAVAATKSPIVFIGTGEHTDEFEPFDGRRFVGRLLGRGDLTAFMEKVQDLLPAEAQEATMDKLASGQFSMRILQEQFTSLMRMGPMSAVMGMLPGFGAEMMPPGQEAQTQARMKRFLALMDSMTEAELDSTKKEIFTPQRIERISRGAGLPPVAMVELLEEYKRLALMFSKMKGMKMPKRGGMCVTRRAYDARRARARRVVQPEPGVAAAAAPTGRRTRRTSTCSR